MVKLNFDYKQNVFKLLYNIPARISATRYSAQLFPSQRQLANALLQPDAVYRERMENKV
jgi:hypothetical protein